MKSRTKKIIQMVSKKTEEENKHEGNLSRDSNPAPSLTELQITCPNLMRSLMNENRIGPPKEESLVLHGHTKAKKIVCAKRKLIFDDSNMETKKVGLHNKYLKSDVTEITKSSETIKEKVENWLGRVTPKHMVSEVLQTGSLDGPTRPTLFKDVTRRDKLIQIKHMTQKLTEKIKQFKIEQTAARKSGKSGIARRKSKQIRSYENSIQMMNSSYKDALEDIDYSSSIIQNDSIERSKKNIFKGRKRNYCSFCNNLVTNYCRHIECNHPDTDEGKELLKANILDPKSRKLKKQQITDILRKKSNDVWNKEVIKRRYKDANCTDELIPVKRRNVQTNLKEESLTCIHCLGLYKRNKLSVHLKYCQSYMKNRDSSLSSPNSSKVQAVRCHGQPLICHSEDITDELKEEVVKFMRHSDVSITVQNDPLIMKMGSRFHKSRRDPTERHYVSREMRDLATLLMKLKELDSTINKLEDVINPMKIGVLVKAVEELGQYDKKSGKLGILSLPYRILHPLSACALIVRKERMVDVSRTNSTDRFNINLVNDFIQMLKDHWASELGRLSTRTTKVNKTLRVNKLALEEDIVTLANYIVENYDTLKEKLEKNPKDEGVYSVLMEMLICHIMCLYRRRPVDCRRATINHYRLLDQHDELIDMARGGNLNDDELDNCKFFHIFYAPGKGHEIVPIVLTPLMKRVLDTLIKHRSDVGITDSRLFLKPQNREINPVQALEKMKSNVKLIKPQHLTNNGLRHQAATFSRLHSSNPLYQDYLASALGHTLHIHKQNYELPTSILQKLIVCPILHRMTINKDKSSNQKQKTKLVQIVDSTVTSNVDFEVPDICIEKDNLIENYKSSETTLKDNRSHFLSKDSDTDDTDKDPDFTPEDGDHPLRSIFKHSIKSHVSRKRWTSQEKEVIFKAFGNDILEKKYPKKADILKLIKENDGIFDKRTNDQVATYVHNATYRKMKNVSPEVKRFMNQHY